MDYKVTEEELVSLANAIRTKGKTTAPLTWVNGFIDAVNNMSSNAPKVFVEGLFEDINVLIWENSAVVVVE